MEETPIYLRPTKAYPTGRKYLIPGGETLMDKFAVAAIAGLCSAFLGPRSINSVTDAEAKTIAASAWKIADAMATQREIISVE